MIPIHILMALAAEPLAIEPGKLQQVMDFLLLRADGVKISAEEIEARVTNRDAKQAAASGGKVAVLPIFGMIMPRVESMKVSERGTPLADVAQTFRGLLADDNVSAIVAQFHSPGGLADGVEEFSQEVFEARGIKPLVAQIDSQAASAAYWIASQFDEVVASPSGHAGAIGVYTVHDDISGALEKLGVKRTVIKSGKFKGEGVAGPLTEEFAARVQERVDTMGRMFRKAVARGRGVTQTKVEEDFGQGDSFGAAELVKRGMADRVDSMKATLERFGVNVSPAMKSATVDMKRALAAGSRVSARMLEAHLCEVGWPGTAAKAIASLGLRGLDSRDANSGAEPAEQPAARGPAASTVRELTALAASVRLPQI